MILSFVFLLGIVVAGFCKTLFVSNYASRIYRLEFIEVHGGEYAIEETARSSDCGLNPAWLLLDQETDTLFCVNEAYTIENSGSVASFTKDLKILSNLTTEHGPSEGALYTPKRLVLPHYAGAALSVIDTSDRTRLFQLQSFRYVLDTPGPNSTLENQPYLHGVAVDPRGAFIVAFDRGSDVIRRYAVGWDDRLIELGTTQTEIGIGPRHGVFVKGEERTFLYVLGELSNQVLVYEVQYPKKGINYQLKLLQTIWNGSGEGGVAVPAEIAAPEPNHLVVSIRNDNKFTWMGDSSDTITTFEIDRKTGLLSIIDLSPSGGKWPRNFAISRDGTLIAVGNQYTLPGRLVVFRRDPESGLYDWENPLAIWTADAALDDGGSLSMIAWDE